MNTDLDLHAVEVDLSNSSVSKTEVPLPSVRLETTDYSRYLRKIAGVNVSSVKWTIGLITVDLIYTLIVLGMGASKQSSCPIEPRIPIYLIVFGSINLVSIGISIAAGVVHYQRKDTSLNGFYFVHGSAALIIILQLFNYIWLLIGSVWIYRAFRDVQYESSKEANYCEKTLYQFSIISTILQFIFSFIFCYCKSLPWNI